VDGERSGFVDRKQVVVDVQQVQRGSGIHPGILARDDPRPLRRA
jgi:hypothetical protein